MGISRWLATHPDWFEAVKSPTGWTYTLNPAARQPIALSRVVSMVPPGRHDRPGRLGAPWVVRRDDLGIQVGRRAGRPRALRTGIPRRRDWTRDRSSFGGRPAGTNCCSTRERSARSGAWGRSHGPGPSLGPTPRSSRWSAGRSILDARPIGGEPGDYHVLICTTSPTGPGPDEFWWGSGRSLSKPEMEWIATTLRTVLEVPATNEPTGNAIRARSDEPSSRHPRR